MGIGNCGLTVDFTNEGKEGGLVEADFRTSKDPRTSRPENREADQGEGEAGI